MTVTTFLKGVFKPNPTFPGLRSHSGYTAFWERSSPYPPIVKSTNLVWRLEDHFLPSTVWVSGLSGLAASAFIAEPPLLFHEVCLTIIKLSSSFISETSSDYLHNHFTNTSTPGKCHLLLLVTMQLLYKDCVMSTVVISPTAEFLRHAVAKTKTNKWKKKYCVEEWVPWIERLGKRSGLLLLFSCLCACIRVSMACMRGSEDIAGDLALSFLHVGPRDRTWIVRLGNSH